MIRVFIADDHGVVRAGVRALLAAEPRLEVVVEADSVDGVMDFFSRADRDADVLVLDLSLRGGSSVDVLRRVRVLRPRLAVLVHTMYAESQYAARMRAEGAAGFLCKDRSEDLLVEAVLTVARRDIFFTADEPPRGPTGGHHDLTARELQVFMMLAAGTSVSEVSHTLGLSMSTVSTHVGRIRAKLGAQTVGEIVAYAHRHGLVG